MTEQVPPSAQEQLDLSVERIMTEKDSEPGVTEYVLVASHEELDTDGSVVTSYDIVVGRHDIPIHAALGLIEYAKQVLLNSVSLRRDDEGDG